MIFFELQNGETVCEDCYEGFGIWMDAEAGETGYYVARRFEHDECIEPCEFCHLFQKEAS